MVPGKYLSKSTAACISCPVGKFASLDGRTHCWSCMAGKYADSTASELCVDCSLGKYMDPGIVDVE